MKWLNKVLGHREQLVQLPCSYSWSLNCSTWAMEDHFFQKIFILLIWCFDDVVESAVLHVSSQSPIDVQIGWFKSFSYSSNYLFHDFFISFVINSSIKKIRNFWKPHWQSCLWMVTRIIPWGFFISMSGAGPLRATVTSLRLGSKGISQVLLTPLKWSVDSRWTLDDCTASSTHFRTYSNRKETWRMQESHFIYIVGNVICLYDGISTVS